MKTYKVTSTQDVTAEQIDDVLVTCFEGGSNYWLEKVRVKEEPTEDYTYMSDVLTRGGTLELRDEDGWHLLTLDRFLKALGIVHFDFENYDALDADTAIQTAIFGDVVYG